MRAWHLTLALAMVVAALFAALPAHAQEAGSGGYYDLEDYSYFAQEAAPAQQEELLPTLPDQDGGGPAPGTPELLPPPPTSPVPVQPPVPPSPQPIRSPPGGTGTGTPLPTPYQPGSPITYPKGDIAGAKAAAKDFGKPLLEGQSGITQSPNLQGTIPGYTGAALPQESLYDNPDSLTPQGAGAAAGNEPWRTVTNPARPVVTLGTDPLARADAVVADPDAYLQGQLLSGGEGACTPLPPSQDATQYYEATCEEGAQPYDEPRSCRIPLLIETAGSVYWEYQCHTEALYRGDGALMCPTIQPNLQVGGCSLIDSTRIGETCLVWVEEFNGRRWCAEPGDPVYRETWSCPAQLPVGGGMERNTATIVSETRDERMCLTATGQASCTQTGEVCTGQPETRIINGLAVTRACWEWERTYQCADTRQATDCGEIQANAQCTFLREECLDDPQVGACKVATKVYRCPLPAGANDGDRQYICGDDVYCIDGDCEPIEREASTEFKDALVGLHTLGQANAEFDEATLTLFSGTRETCHKKLFGLSNCCSGKGVPLLTPFLCNAAERELDKKDDQGLCHRIGSYCSDKVLGICVTRKDAFCCFESKLSRILQEQGRIQLRKPWGDPKTATCKGFTLAEFQQLDLSVMDFSEVYAEFMDAAKLPDELETTQQIQQRIQDYFAQHGGS